MNNMMHNISIRVDDNTNDKLNELVKYYDISKTQLLKKMIDSIYDRDIMGNDFSPDAKKGCMAHMCNIVTHANCIEDDEVRKNILEEVRQACLILR